MLTDVWFWCTRVTSTDSKPMNWISVRCFKSMMNWDDAISLRTDLSLRIVVSTFIFWAISWTESECSRRSIHYVAHTGVNVRRCGTLGSRTMHNNGFCDRPFSHCKICFTFSFAEARFGIAINLIPFYPFTLWAVNTAWLRLLCNTSWTCNVLIGGRKVHNSHCADDQQENNKNIINDGNPNFFNLALRHIRRSRFSREVISWIHDFIHSISNNGLGTSFSPESVFFAYAFQRLTESIDDWTIANRECVTDEKGQSKWLRMLLSVIDQSSDIRKSSL